MSDFPHPGSLPIMINSWSRYCLAPDIRRIASASGEPGAITWVANQAVYMPLVLPWAYPVKRMFWFNGSTITTTNVDIGIYTIGGGKIFTAGATAQVGASAIQYVSCDFMLAPGSYWLAWSCNNTTARAWGVTLTAAQGAMLGLTSQGTAEPLPASLTPVTFGAPGPVLCGITRKATGF